MRIGELVATLPDAKLCAGDPDEPIDGVCYDSRKATIRSAFVAIRGRLEDGNLYVDDARRRGAKVVISEGPPLPGGAWIQVTDARVALAEISAVLFDRPADAMTLVGVTGTNGKTTTCYLIESALRAAGRAPGLLGTVEYRFADQIVEASRTTPESSDLQALLRDMLTAGCRHVVMEVSSHSLMLERVRGCSFEVAVFMNLTRDHLDFHGDMDSYFSAKRRLFVERLKTRGTAIVNTDDDRGHEIAAAVKGRVWTFGLEKPADLRAESVSLSLDGTCFKARTPVGDFTVESPLVGRFNVENLLAALGAALALEIEPAEALSGLSGVRGVPGRLERIDMGQGFTVIVDYAHTDDAIRKLLETIRQLKPRRVLTVFGCGGDRDATKRPLMGAVAARLSDVVIVTSDNPRGEPPEAIIEAVERGMNGSRGAERLSVIDRREAIARALEMAETGDVVVIAGKGHERTQQLRDRVVPFDDREIVRGLLGATKDRGSEGA
ncbi:MAG: UDP-N-acetylmuramoyl-L-alanyl-D-glutamate--2,6-diaminopimelate ligase [Vicinamibacteria bacterium]|nr:UDP-N-acetylmuramoyl-L-alanyl-D-glutamate--2,6-diaminopimelate ligase [Vicinamibacteria bacterium]